MRINATVAHLLSALLLLAGANWSGAEDRLKALIVDGQNNHNWKACTPAMAWILEQSGRFTVTVSTTPGSQPPPPQSPKNATPEQLADYQARKKAYDEAKGAHVAEREAAWKAWRPAFREADVVVSNYNGEAWPDEVKQSLVAYVGGGGGFVVVHAADNSFPDWPEFNEMIGVGGWGGRNEKSGPMLRWRDGAVVRDETPGGGGTHGKRHEFLVEARVPEHPILKGLPAKWRHASDELYAKMRGPAKNLTVLATAYSAPEQNGTKEHEPILMVIEYGKGRVFHTVLGHDTTSMSGLGFQVTLARGAEWAASGTVTLPPPAEGLPEDKAALRPMPAP